MQQPPSSPTDADPDVDVGASVDAVPIAGVGSGPNVERIDTASLVSGFATLRVLLIDDEELARLRLATLVAQCPSPSALVVGEAGSVAGALAWLESNRCDVVLLDIQMPGAEGLQLAAVLRERAAAGHTAPAVVFVTAHEKHALKAFELDATDYLTKPVRRERLQAALSRVAQRLALLPASARAVGMDASRSDARLPAAAPAAPNAIGLDGVPAVGSTPASSVTSMARLPLADSLIVTERGRIVRVPLGQVVYLKAELKYVTLRTAGHAFVLDEPLSDLEQRLGARFMRIHRNALVARRAVSRLERRAMPGEGEDGEGWAVKVEPVGEWLAVSRRQLAAVREAVAAYGV